AGAWRSVGFVRAEPDRGGRGSCIRPRGARPPHPEEGFHKMKDRIPSPRRKSSKASGGSPAESPSNAATVDALLDLADDLEEQGRDLIRQARQVQRLAEKLGGGTGARQPVRRSGPTGRGAPSR